MGNWSELITVVVSVGTAIYALERVYYYKKDEAREERMTKAHEDIAVILTRMEKTLTKENNGDL